jgi:hypothetical protein
VRIVIDQLWHLWPFLERGPARRGALPPIHYLDAIRGIAGEPAGVYGRSVDIRRCPPARRPEPIILDYGDRLRCSLSSQTHRPNRAPGVAAQSLRAWAVRFTWGVNPDYPTGLSDTMRCGRAPRGTPCCADRGSSKRRGPMSTQRFVAGEDTTLVGAVDDAVRTMALVEACYESSARGGTPIP